MVDEDTTANKDFQKCADFHGHVCPGLALGYRAARAGLDWLHENRSADEELIAIVETDACCADAIQVITGCTFGKGNFIYKDYGKMAFTFFSRGTGSGVRIVLRPDSTQRGSRFHELVKKIRDDQASEVEKQEFDSLQESRMKDILKSPIEKLFSIKEVNVPIPPKAVIGPSKPCARCDEPVMSSKLVSVGGELLCGGCVTHDPN